VESRGVGFELLLQAPRTRGTSPEPDRHYLQPTLPVSRFFTIKLTVLMTRH
jgi:hypothetical protein